jgi:hypothetical protein
VTKTTLVVLGLLLALAGCSDADADETVTAAQLPANLCDLVPAGQAERWDLVEDTSSTDNDGPINSADCMMTAGSELDDPRLELRVNSLGGGDAESATRFADEMFADDCGNVRSNGEYADTRDECTASLESDGTLTLTSVTRLPDSHSVVRVQLVTPAADADAADDAVADLVEAVRGEVEGASA